MHNERIIEYYESCAQDTIRNAMKTYCVFFSIIFSFKLQKKLGVLAKISKTKVKLNYTESQLENLEKKLAKLQKNSYAKSFSSSVEFNQKSFLVDFPFLAKI